MHAAGMMTTSTDEPGWPGYNETIDIFPQKTDGYRAGLGKRGGGGGGMCKNSLGTLNYNEIIAGVLGWEMVFGLCVCVCVCVCVSQKL